MSQPKKFLFFCFLYVLSFAPAISHFGKAASDGIVAEKQRNSTVAFTVQRQQITEERTRGTRNNRASATSAAENGQNLVHGNGMSNHYLSSPQFVADVEIGRHLLQLLNSQQRTAATETTQNPEHGQAEEGGERGAITAPNGAEEAGDDESLMVPQHPQQMLLEQQQQDQVVPELPRHRHHNHHQYQVVPQWQFPTRQQQQDDDQVVPR